MARGPRHEFTILCIMHSSLHSSLWLHLHLSWLHFHCGPHKCPHMAVFHCSGNPNLPLQSHGLHAEHTALSRPTDANVLPQPLSASPGVYAAQTNKKELMVTAEQLQARHATEIHPRCSRDAAAVPPPTLLSHTHHAHTALSPRAPGLAL